MVEEPKVDIIDTSHNIEKDLELVGSGVPEEGVDDGDDDLAEIEVVGNEEWESLEDNYDGNWKRIKLLN